MPEIVFEFKQKSFLKGSRTFTVFDDDTIRGVYRDFWSIYEYCRPLADFDPVPRVNFYFDMPMLIGAVLTGISAIALFVLGLYVNPLDGAHVASYGFSAFFAFCAALCLISLRRKNQRILVFISESASQMFDHIVLYHRRPSVESFDEFVKFLRTRISQAKINSPKSRGQDVARQLHDLVRMKEEGHLTLYEFEKAKARVLNGDKV
jgi:hypothetical protein